ncbi:hypothetical protein [Paenibacillus sp. GCM10027626]
MPDEILDRLGSYFVHHNLYEKHGVTFERFVQMWKNGTWEPWWV